MSKRIHFIGIGGVGMAALAVLVKARGDEVTGCDISASARTRWLESQGIRVFTGHDPSHLESVDELVVTPAVNPGLEELKEFLRRRGRGKVRFRGEVLAEIVSACDSIAVCGSHGKTTTSTFIAKLLAGLGEDVAWAIGGETDDMPVARAGKGPLVVEADESDGTLALYRAKTLVVNKCEYDHPDHFKTEEDYFACYENAKRNAGEVINSEALDLEGWEIPVSGEHNRRNARAAIEVALRRGHSREAVESVLAQAVNALPDRRFERLAEGVYTDYAHHPTELRCAVEMAREVCRGKLRVLFQPHRYSRTRALLGDFPPALSGADELVVCPTYAAFEEPLEGGDEADLYRACREAGSCGRLYLARSCEEAWTHAFLSMEEGDVTLLLGAGDIIKLSAMVREGRVSPPRKMWIGMGSNTWKSDLRNDDRYVRTRGPADRPGASLVAKFPFMAGIPGTIGGWVKMNAGAFGYEIGRYVSRVLVDGKWIGRDECGFAYRHSGIDGEIQDVEFVDPAEPMPPPEEFLARRRRFPAGTRGSVFKNPPGDYAGRLLEEAGAKSLRVGGAYVWSGHANVIVAGDGATASDVLALSRLMRLKVFHRFGIKLEAEVAGL